MKSINLQRKKKNPEKRPSMNDVNSNDINNSSSHSLSSSSSSSSPSSTLNPNTTPLSSSSSSTCSSSSGDASTEAPFKRPQSLSISISPPQSQPQSQLITSMTSRDPDVPFTGGGINILTGKHSIRFSYGFCTFKGKRGSMEDYLDSQISEIDGQRVAFFGVFDGHGGPRTAEYLKKNLFNNLCSHPDFIKDTTSAIVEAFKQTDANFLSEEKANQKDAGSTASTALLVGDRLLVANVGDSRVVACRDGTAIPLSVDHKPDRTDERQRIENAGGFVIWAGTWRVGGVLAVSRAFGDKLLKEYVTAEPEIQEQEIAGIDFIIIASDGLWNVISNKEAVSIVQNIKEPEQASRTLTEKAFGKGSSDNITCLVVRFHNGKQR